MKKILITIFTSVILLLCVGLSYSYFTGKINGEDKELLVTSKNVRILFTDSREIANDDIKPGWNETKTFSVKNESNDNFNYNIVFENLVNTFVTEGFLQYKITSSNGYNMEGYLDIPKSSTPKTIVLAYDIDIQKDITHEYTIEFIYHDSTTVDQSDDMGKIFEGNLAITEGTVNPNIKYTTIMNSEHGTITPESNQTVKKGDLEFSVAPDTGYDVSTMSVSCTPVANTVITGNKIKVNDIRQDHECTVSFDKETYTVNIVVNNGTSGALNKVVEYGGGASDTITPNYGYTLVGATVEGTGCSLDGDTLNITNVQSNGTCTVTLPRDKYTVTLTGTGIASSNSPQEAEYESETSINFTLSDGYELGDNVINCDNGEPTISGNVLTVNNVTNTTTCILSTILKSYDVTLKVNGGTPESETKQITHNGSGTYTIANDTGHKFELDESIKCTGNATGSLSGSTVTISGVTTTQECTVELKRQTYTVNVSSNNNAYGTVDPTSSVVSHGDDLEITLNPVSKYLSNDCGGTITSENILTIPNITGNKECTVTFDKLNTLADTIKAAYPSSGPRSWFNDAYTTTALHTATDYDSNGNFSGTTYYLTGNPNNWVKFGKTSDGKDALWRIIRINGNGSVRLLYAGTGGEDGYLIDVGQTTYSINSSTYNNPAYVGWKYSTNGTNGRGTSATSGVYNKVKSWYDTNIGASSKTDGNTPSKKLSDYIDTNAVYCNDRTASTSGANDTSYTTFTASDNSETVYYYGGWKRLVNNNRRTPTLDCNTNDQFKDGFGLITADEVAYAGGGYGKTNESAYYYLNKDGKSSIGTNYWWTMSPFRWNGEKAEVFYVVGSASPANLANRNVDEGRSVVRPVVSLKSTVLVTGGKGTGSEPYKLSLN